MKILKCDNCGNEIAKEPNIIIANKRELDICNDCWQIFVKAFRGLYPLAKLGMTPKGELQQKGKR